MVTRQKASMTITPEQQQKTLRLVFLRIAMHDDSKWMGWTRSNRDGSYGVYA
jgi:hypothetical protein